MPEGSILYAIWLRLSRNLFSVEKDTSAHDFNYMTVTI